MNLKEDWKKKLAKCNNFKMINLMFYLYSTRKDKLTKTELQRQLKEATSNEHCHANVSLLNEISYRTGN